MTELSQLRLRCRRGMKELDIVLNRYLENTFRESTVQDKNSNQATTLAAFQELLKLEDDVLYAMILGHTKPENSAQRAIIHQLCQNSANNTPNEREQTNVTHKKPVSPTGLRIITK